jgi:hypothetical protein
MYPKARARFKTVSRRGWLPAMDARAKVGLLSVLARKESERLCAPRSRVKVSSSDYDVLDTRPSGRTPPRNADARRGGTPSLSKKTPRHYR